MLDTQGRLEAEIEDLRKQRDEERRERQAFQMRLIEIEALLAGQIGKEEPDVVAFGRGAWVYCNQHMRPHPTGWCTVSPRDKMGLGVKTAQEAYDKCREWNLPLYADRNKD